jgi:hypothetical protein
MKCERGENLKCAKTKNTQPRNKNKRKSWQGQTENPGERPSAASSSVLLLTLIVFAEPWSAWGPSSVEFEEKEGRRTDTCDGHSRRNLEQPKKGSSEMRKRKKKRTERTE